MNWLIFIWKENEKCLLCIELLLFLSLKMKLWHITDTGLDFANIPALTHVHLVEQLSCSAASSPCALQRSRNAAGTGAAAAGSSHPLPLRPLWQLPGWLSARTVQPAGSKDSAARAAWPKISCFWKRRINSTRMLYFSSVILTGRILELFSEHGYMLRSTQPWTHRYTRRCTCLCRHLHSHV